MGVDVVKRIGQDINYVRGKHGPYLERRQPGPGGAVEVDRIDLPFSVKADALTVREADALLALPYKGYRLGAHPETGRSVVARAAFGRAYAVEVGSDDEERGDRASLPIGMTWDTVTLAHALELLALPRLLGVDPGTGEEVWAKHGKHGPFVASGKRSCSLPIEAALSIPLADAMRLLAGSDPRDLGLDPANGRAIAVRTGRYGAYVTDGQTSASLRAADERASLTLEQATDLLGAKRLGPSDVSAWPSTSAGNRDQASAANRPWPGLQLSSVGGFAPF